MNHTLADVAADRADRGIGPTTSGYCQMWARLTVQAVYGHQWDQWLHKPSAKLAGEAFWQAFQKGLLPAGATVIRSGRVADTQVGDVLYRTLDGGEFGHVSIRVEGNRVAENSSVHHGPHGAIGFRPLDGVKFDTIVRLPDPNVATPRPSLELLRDVYAALAKGNTAGATAALNEWRRSADGVKLYGQP